MLLEVCIDNLASALAAQKGGANRLEVCARLDKGGLTPTNSFIQEIIDHTALPLRVMIRPTDRDFCYTDDEFAQMQQSVEIAKVKGVEGVVFGILDREGNIDIERNRKLLDLAKPLRATFHRAFDGCSNPFISLHQLIELGFDTLLTSGQETTALEGVTLISELVDRSAGRIEIMPGSGIHSGNVREIVAKSDSTSVHGSLKAGGVETDEKEVANVISILDVMK